VNLCRQKNYVFYNLESTPKSGHFGLKSGTALIIYNLILKDGVIQRSAFKGFEPQNDHFSEWTQY